MDNTLDNYYKFDFAYIDIYKKGKDIKNHFFFSYFIDNI